jgi:hypothetical protein
VHPLRAAGLDERFHPDRLQRVAHDQSALAHLREGRAVTRVEVEVHVVRTIDVVALRVPLVQVDAPQVHHPQERGQIVNHREVDDVAVAVIDRAGADPGRPRRGRALHEEEGASGAVWIPLHHHGAVGDVREENACDVRVVLNQAALRDAALRPERLAQVRQADIVAGHAERRVIGVGGNLKSRRPWHRYQKRQTRWTRRSRRTRITIVIYGS